MQNKPRRFQDLLNKKNVLAILLGVVVIGLLSLLKALLNFATFYSYIHSVDISNSIQVKNFQINPPLYIRIMLFAQSATRYLAPIIGGIIATQKARNHKIFIAALTGFLWNLFIFVILLSMIYMSYNSMSSHYSQDTQSFIIVQQMKDKAINDNIQEIPKALLITTLLSTFGGLFLICFLKYRKQHNS